VQTEIILKKILVEVPDHGTGDVVEFMAGTVLLVADISCRSI
jgi:hypothetical protein